ncbi:MAG: arginase [Alphaproteobacteria bacterium]|jgi:arginase|nr:arginase [Alphaproteobacteria bacterium]
MNKTNYQIYGIASGIAAEKYGAQLGVWDMYYSLPNINQHMENIFCSDSNKTKLDVITDIAPLYQQVNAKVVSNYVAGDKYLFFTGDHANGVATWSSISNAVQKNMGLIWIDAHLDCHTPESSDSKNVHGMPVAHLMGYGDSRLSSLIKHKFKPQNIAYIATRDFEEAELDFVNKHGIKVFFMKDINTENVNAVFAEAIAHVSQNVDYFGISLDIDSMSPEFAPGTGCYNPNGLDSAWVLENIKAASNHEKFLGLEITEYNPLLDENRKTFKVIMDIVKSILL